MAKRQTRRSISVSRSTYERLRAYCETNGISMSQFVETRVGDFLGRSSRRPGDERLSETVASAPISVAATRPPPVVLAPAPVAPPAPATVAAAPAAVAPAPAAPAPVVRPVTSAPVSVAVSSAPTGTAGRPAPTPAPRPAPPPAKLTPDQIFTF